ncbi:UDP-N-acetylmuramate:L-alanyl-gamma-D-glutamyl-meso-diaminopimelate ligase [Derxia gummosa]|uniref:UDP-N-acetylmuramate--L-alanyl-gamma-D-glutamyl-meso-2,6-diaminoheptandioate ligase n=1 Tax=Derxia gummosa DSM 723 TaxID=1121388 RepID=A0A8B6X2T5_9BURK|nr:UDP-N-acetylmuramate:L-alanyl-gamma-D-glutamyl-meso-diaminopimelate ligase [Derxia gummosa]
MHIHILGICGTFMGGVAQLARQAGHRVTGCDANVYPPMSTQLEAAGIELIQGWSPEQLGLVPDLFVIGNVVSRGNPLMEAILDAGLPYVSGPQWVAEHILAGRHVLAVAGTHGKTTTSSLLAWILEDAGLAPGFLIGGVPLNFGVSARLHGATPSPFFVIEADEYDTAFFDKRSKFVHYRPRTAILNNLEFDHADIFPDLGAIETQFHHLVRTVPGGGRLVVNAREAALERVLKRGCWSGVERFGAEDGWRVREVEAGTAAAAGATHGAVTVSQAGTGTAELEFLRGNAVIGRLPADVFDGALQGEHNRMNALAALAAAEHAGVAPERALDALRRFRSVKRRMELRGEAAGVRVYDDFAHHPTAIETTIAGLRHAIGAGPRILAVLEPRSNTMKLGTMKAQLPGSLAGADLVFGYGARDGKDALGWDLAEALAPLGARARAFTELAELVNAVAAAAQPGDRVLVMSNGGFGGVHHKLLEALAGKGE